MKNGFRVIDTDTHVGPNVETLYEYASPALRARWDELKAYEVPVTEGHHWSIGPIPFKRKMNEKPGAEEVAVKGGAMSLKGKMSDFFKVPPQPEVNNMNASGRLADMDLEGRDMDFIIPATFSTAVSAIAQDLALEAHSAYNRYIADYCAADVTRLKAAMLVLGSDPEWAAREIKMHAQEAHVAACTVVLPENMSIDDPDLHPIWQALDENDLPILHHSFFYEPPYFPGYRDVWGNIVVARAAAHPWGAARLVAYLCLSGLFDQYPRLRIGFAECSAGWLPAWLIRLKGQADYLRKQLPDRAMDPVEYGRSGRIYCGIELYEGEEMAQAIIDILGDEVLMFQSDYPHPGCAFPESPDVVLSWKGLGETALRKIMHENAERYLRLL
jgi:predicted TIM-barrel fold metal-dependent hydrolase